MYLIADAWGWLSLESWLAVLMTVIGLGLVIFVHELGHFLVAKMCGVKCEKFYVGFDVPIRIGWGRHSVRLPSALWKRKWGETEYGIGIIPLGGYVKMLGQDDNPGRAAEAAAASRQAGTEGQATDKLDPRSYLAQSVPERMAIISAGVVMNVIFAFLFALLAIEIGVPYVPCFVAHTLPGLPAWREDLRPRDELTKINGLKKPRFDDLQQQLFLSDPNVGINVDVLRPGTGTFNQTLRPDPDDSNRRPMPMIGVVLERQTTLESDLPPTLPNTPAAALPADKGFLGGDKVVAIDGQPIKDDVDYAEMLARNPAKPLAITVERRPADKPDAAPQRVTITVLANPWRHLGLTMTMGRITAVQKDSPAMEAKSSQVTGGLQRGDLITRVAGQPAGDPMTLPMRMQPRDGKEVRIEVERPAAAAGAPAQKIEFSTRLTTPTWFNEDKEAFEDGPVAWLALGATYSVESRVTAVDASAAKAGIAPGDEVLKATFLPPPNPTTDVEKLEAKSIGKMKALEFGPDKRNWPLLIGALQYCSPQTQVRLTVKKGSVTRDIDLSSETSNEFFNPERGLNFNPRQEMLVVHSFGEAADFAWRETKASLLMVYISLKKVAYHQVSADQLGGPVMIAAGAASSAKQGLSKFLLFLTIISANLAVVNFLPIPVLDGGHMMFLILEGIFRRPVSEKIVIPLTYAGLFFILSLMVFVFGLDIHRFWPF